MGRPAGWMAALTGRSPMKSPGAPALQREVERQFWREIAKGLLAEEAAAAVGVSQAAGCRWFRHAGGMPPMDLAPQSGRCLSFHEREEIAILKAQGIGVRCATSLPRSVDGIPRAAAQRRDPWRPTGLPGFGRAVEGHPRGPAPEASEAGRERSAAGLRAGKAFRPGQPPGRDGTGAGGPAVEG